MIRHFLAALAASLIVGACSDSTGPHVTPPAAGVYVLRSINGASLPNDDVYPSYVTVAETLFVAPDHSYFVAGAYYARYVPSLYQVSPQHTFQISGDSVVAPTLGQGANGLGGFGAAAITMLGDTVVASYLAGGITHYVRVPTPPPPGPVASLVLTKTDTLLLQGGTLDVQRLVLRGLDANGLWIAHPVPSVGLVPPAGWTASGTVLTAPAAGESEATIGIPSGHASTPLTVRSVIDLRTRKWRISWSCGNGLRKYPYANNPPSPVYRDSLSFAATVDSVAYYRRDLYERYDAKLWVRPTIVQYLSDGEVKTSTPDQTGSQAIVITRQAPDTVIYGPTPGSVARPVVETTGTVSQVSPRVYTGGNMCAKDLYGTFRPAVLAETP